MLHLIFNPVAGRGRAPAALATACGLLDAAGVGYQLYTSNAPGHATELAAATPPGAVVVAVGGDGTVHEVVRGLVRGSGHGGSGHGGSGHDGSGHDGAGAEGGRKTLGVLPVGSGDDFAFAIGLERHDMRAAVARLITQRPVAVDLGWVNGEPFVNALGVGFDAEVAFSLQRAPTFLKGVAAYLYAVLVSLGRSRPAQVRVRVDDEKVFEGRSLLVAIQNGPRTGGSFLFAPSARNDDGQLDVVIAGDLTLPGTLALLPRVMRGAHLGHPKVQVLSGTSIEVDWAQPRHAHTEGEPLGAATRHQVFVQPGGLRVLGPVAALDNSGRSP